MKKTKKGRICYTCIFRHGQTIYNRDKRFTGWKESKLTKLGIKQAQIIAKKLKNKRFEVAIQTKLSRSKDSLKPVLKHHPECKKIITDNKMIERSYGSLQGKYHKDIIKKFGKKQFDIWHRSYNIPPPKGESIKIVEKRVLSFIKWLLKYIKKNKVNVVISAHGNSMRPFRRYFEKISIKKMMKWTVPFDKVFTYKVRC